MLHGILMRVLD